jgi:hypothetical protein
MAHSKKLLPYWKQPSNEYKNPPVRSHKPGEGETGNGWAIIAIGSINKKSASSKILPIESQGYHQYSWLPGSDGWTNCIGSIPL